MSQIQKEQPRESKLWLAIKLRDKAIKKKAHPKIIRNLDLQVKDEARAAIDRMYPNGVPPNCTSFMDLPVMHALLGDDHPDVIKEKKKLRLVK